MGLRAPVSGVDGGAYEVPAAGSYIGRCVTVAAVGLQPGYQGAAAKQQIVIEYELHKRKGPAVDSQGRIHKVAKIVTLSANIDANLVAIAGAMRGKKYSEDELRGIKAEGGLDIEHLLGGVARVQVEHNNGKAKVGAITPVDPEEDTIPSAVSDEIYWDPTLGSECPKGLVTYMWTKALDNPERREQPAPATAGVGTRFDAPKDDDFRF